MKIPKIVSSGPGELMKLNQFRKKILSKFMVWGAMTPTRLSELHIVPQNTSINAVYYQKNILNETLAPMLNLNHSNGPLIGRKCPEKKSDMTFMQDGAHCNTAHTTLLWLQDQEIKFWDKDEWPPNFLDLNPIENLWSILEETMKSEKKQLMEIEN